MSDHLRTADWYKSATRWTQLTLAEDDPVKFDPDQWIDIFKRTNSNATCLSAGGYIAYYPSKVPLHYVSKFIGDSDPFGSLVEGARRLDMHVMARVDPHAIHQDAADAHPEWIALDKDGNPRRHWAFPEVWVTCAYGSYNMEFMPEVVKEITRDYDIDAVFANRWQGHGVCYCKSCTDRFKAASGYDLPTQAKADDPVWKAWAGWRREILTRLVIHWDEEMKAIKPNTSFIPNMGGASLTEFDLSLIEKHCPFLVVDDQARRGFEQVWMSGRNGKRMRGTFRERPVILITSVGPEEGHRWKDSVNTGPETESWITNGVVQGMRAWFTKFNGVIPDTRWIEPVGNAFDLHARIEPVLTRTSPSAEIALIDPATTLRHWAAEHRREAEQDDLGIYQALVEAGLPFEFLSDQMMTPEALDRFKVVVVSSARCLSDAQCDALRAYVARGGSVVGAFEVASLDADGNPRDRMGLEDLFGIKITGGSRGPVKNTYIALNGTHPINRGYEGATRVIGGTHLMAVEADAGTEAPFLFVPDFPDLPMEEVYPREEPRGAAVVARETGQGGRTVYFPFNIGAIFAEVMAQDHQRLTENAVRWALGRPSRIEISGQAVLDIALRDGEGETLVLLQNLSNPMMLKGPTREYYPVGEQTLSVVLPDGARGAEARLLIADKAAEVAVKDGRAEVKVCGIELLEAVHLSWT